MSSRLATKRTSLLLSAVFATLTSAALAAGPAGGGGGGGAAGGSGLGGATSFAGGARAASGGSGHPARSIAAAHEGLRTGSRLQGSPTRETADAVRHITVDGKPAMAVRLPLDRPLRPEDERKLYWRGFRKVGHPLGPNNSPLYCSHSLYNGERECIWFGPVPFIG